MGREKAGETTENPTICSSPLPWIPPRHWHLRHLLEGVRLVTSEEQVTEHYCPRGPLLSTACILVPLASELFLTHTPGPSVLGLGSSCFLLQAHAHPALNLLPTNKILVIFPRPKCDFLQDVFPGPSQQGHISPRLSLSSAIFLFTKWASAI